MQQGTSVDKKSPHTTRPVTKKSKTEVTPSSSSSVDGEGNSVKCINRKLQVTPKCQRKLYVRELATKSANKPPVSPARTTAVRRSPLSTSKTRKFTNSKNNTRIQPLICPSTFRIPDNASCRKSISMIDISPNADFARINQRSRGNFMMMGQETPKMPCLKGESISTIWLESTPKTPSDKDDDEDMTKRAGKLICHVLILNAWRRKRDEVVELQGTIESLGQKIDHLQLQIVVLRKLLDTENSRVSKLGAEVHRAKTQLDGVIQEKNKIHEKNETLEEELKKLQELSEDRRTAAENFKNDLNSTKNQLDAIDSQMNKEREKILQLREDKRMLLEEVSNCEALANERGERAEIAEKTVEELQDKLSIHEGIIESLQEDKLQLEKDLKNSEMEKMELVTRLLNNKETEKTLNKRMVNLENQLRNREADLQRIESMYDSQILEIKEMKDRLIQQSKENGWSRKVLQIAGSVVRVPGVILRTLSFLSPGGISSHP